VGHFGRNHATAGCDGGGVGLGERLRGQVPRRDVLWAGALRARGRGPPLCVQRRVRSVRAQLPARDAHGHELRRRRRRVQRQRRLLCLPGG
jgi:hypothetical protein